MSWVASWRLCTPAYAAGAIAIIEIRAENRDRLDAAMRVLTGHDVSVGSAPLREFAHVDHGIAARANETTCFLMFHGGPQVVRSMCEELDRHGFRGSSEAFTFPEARDAIEDRMLRALAVAQSPDAIDALLAQPTLWRGEVMTGECSEEDRALNQLIHPPIVAAIGAANIGKSSLLNALAGRTVAVAADEPGTTTDHVGVRLILDGLCVHFVDTPGIRAGAPEHERRAARASMRMADDAAMLLLCGDHTSAPPLAPAGFRGKTLRVNLRADLGQMACDADVSVSVHDAVSIERLAGRIREELVPRRLLQPIRRWRFDECAPERTTDGGRS